MRHLRILSILVFTALAVTSCGPSEEETVSFDDLAPNAQRDYDKENGKQDTLIVTNERPDKSPFLRVVDTLMADSRWVKWDTLLFPDRFGPKQQEKWFSIGSNDSLTLLRYEFKDSLRTKNAFFNWIDCFGPKCRSYIVGGNIRIPKRHALVLVGAKQLIVIEGNKAIDEKKIRAVFEKDPKKENWLYLVAIPKSGVTTWRRIDKGEEKPIIRTDENS